MQADTVYRIRVEGDGFRPDVSIRPGKISPAGSQGDAVEMLWVPAETKEYRILVGAKPVQSEHTPLRLFDKSNVAQAGTPPKDSTGYGNAYVERYKALWGLK